MLDCVVVGAGPAGLATSRALTGRGVDHVVLERGRVGQTWRTQRWDSLRLNNPGWMNPMLGPQPRETYLGAGEVVRRLDRLAAACPVRESAAVTGLRRGADGWRVRTAGGELGARTVVVATGGENVPRTPELAGRLPRRLSQCHAAQYRAAAQLPDGGVLVVGSAQSGYQIAEELLAAGRRVVVATSAVGRAPAWHRGRSTLEWLVRLGFFAQRPEDLPDPSVARAPQPLLAPGGRGADLRSLAGAGAVLAGRLTTVDGERIGFDGSLPANIAFADAFTDRIREAIDDGITANGLDAPSSVPEDAVAPAPRTPPDVLDLRGAGIDSVVWCTGYTGDFSWLDPALTDARGRPVRHGAAAAVPGLWYLGLRWLTCRGSGNFIGFPADAAVVAGAIATYLAGTRSRARGGRRLRCDRPHRTVADAVAEDAERDGGPEQAT